MKNLSSIIVLSILFCSAAFAQNTKVLDTIPIVDTASVEPVKKEKPQKAKKPLKDKIYFGGGVGVSFGSYTRLAVYPMIGYKFTPKLSGGIEVGYEYVSNNNTSPKYETSNYGFSLLARYRLLPPVFIHAEYAMYNYEFYLSDNNTEREWVPFLFLGAGFVKNIGGRSSVYAMVKFDLLQNDKSPYNDWEPWFAVGVSVGF